MEIPVFAAEGKTLSSVPGAPLPTFPVLKGEMEDAALSGVLNSAML